MDTKYQEPSYKEIQHNEVNEKLPHPYLKYKNIFPNNKLDPYTLNSYNFDEGNTPFHTMKHQHMDVEFHIESHLLDTLENIRKNVKGKEDMSITQDNLIVMDRIDVLETNLKTHVTNAKNEIKNHTTTEVNTAENNIVTNITNAKDSINNHVTSESNSLWNKINNAFSVLRNIINN